LRDVIPPLYQLSYEEKGGIFPRKLRFFCQIRRNGCPGDKNSSVIFHHSPAKSGFGRHSIGEMQI
jgi:hypothetical protein